MISQKRFDNNLSGLIGTFAYPAKPIVAGVSGGPDSVVMLQLLAGSRLGLEVAVAHMDFSLRGEESTGDAQFVEELASTLGLKFYSRKVDTLGYAKEHGLSVEMAARELRYRWFAEVLADFGTNLLAIAHNADDNAETLLLNLVRGTGLKGLCGIKPLAPLPYFSESEDGCADALTCGLQVVRPLLIFERNEIEAYIAEKGLAFRTDRTNAENDASRNKIRNLILPQLRQINPSVVATLNADIARFGDAYSLLTRTLGAERGRIVKYRRGAGGGKSLAAASRPVGDGYRRMLIGRFMELSLNARALAECGSTTLLLELLDGYGFSPVQAEELMKALGGDHRDAKYWRSESFVMYLEGGCVNLYSAEVLDDVETAEIREERALELDGGEMSLLVKRLEWSGEGSPVEGCRELVKRGVLVMDASKLKFPLRLRGTGDGDFFAPLGMKRGNKGIKDYLGERNLERVLRHRVFVIEDATGKIVALPGFQIAESVKVEDESRELLSIAIDMKH